MTATLAAPRPRSRPAGRAGVATRKRLWPWLVRRALPAPSPAIPSAPMPTTTSVTAASFARPIAAAAACPKATGRSAHGIHTVRRPLARARAVAAATCGAVLDSGAGAMPWVIRPMTNPGRTMQQPHTRAVQGVGQAAGEPVQTRLGRSVDVVGPAHPHPGDRGEHDDAPGAGRPHRRRQHGQQADLRDVVGVHDGHGVGGVGLGAGLVAEDPERQHRGADRAVLGDDRVDQRAVRRQVVGVEFLARERSAAPAARSAATCS